MDVRGSLSRFAQGVGIPRLLIGLFLVFLFVVAYIQKLPMAMLLNGALVRTAMNGILVLAMVPTIQAGVGLNFGLPVGVVCGLVGALLAMEHNLRGFTGFGTALAIGIPLAAVAGLLYGQLLNRVKGQEMMVGTYVGFSVVAGMSVFWLLGPFRNPEMIWVVGGSGLRYTLTLSNHYGHVLNQALNFRLLGVLIPGGLVLFYLSFCLLMAVFLRTRVGMAMSAAGSNPAFAAASGISVDNMRLLAVVLSTVLGAVGIVVYAQSFGFLQLYVAPMFMAFPSVAAILIGGASTRRASVLNVIVGALLFHTMLATALPVTRTLMEGDISEVARIIVSNGMILYALTRGRGGN
ncbi:MAG: ABC transporter permease [bacterium]|nr:ABC transporter permease [bacterium]